MTKKVAIIIPTKNRSKFIINLLKYYAEIESHHTLYISDASDSYHTNAIIPIIKSLRNDINIIHKQYPEYGRSVVDLGNSVKKILEFVEEEYVVGSGDDDYFIPNSLDKCVDFLENNLEYSSAHGYGTFLVYDDTEGKSFFKERYNINEYKAESASLRLKMYFNNYSPLFFSVQRTKIFRKAYKNFERLPISPDAFVEIMPASMSAILGNSKKLNLLYLIRGINPHRFKQNRLMNQITDSGWSNSVDIFIDTLSEEISILDGIDGKKSKAIVNQRFVDYLEKNILEQNYKNNTLSSKSIKKRILNKFKQSIPFYVKKIIKNKVVSNDYYDASGRLSKESLHYHELKSILNNTKE